MKRKIIPQLISFISLYFTLVPSVTVILSPLLFIMFFPLGILFIQTLPWPLLRYIPDPFGEWSSLYYLNYCWSILLYSSVRIYLLLVSYILIVIGSAIFLWGLVYWIKYGGELITKGPYKMCRHPQYLGIIIGVLGFTLMSMRPIANISWVIMTYIYILMASLEEHYITKKVSDYAIYKSKVPFIIPGIKFIGSIENKKDLFIYTIVTIVIILVIIYIAQYRVVSLKGVY